jgi:serine/threonine protein phosphatase PrpC
LEVFFIVSVGDGVFDKLINENVSQAAWKVFKEGGESIHHLAGKANEEIIRTALTYKAFDNITGILIVFEGVHHFLQGNTKDNGKRLKSTSELCANKKTIIGDTITDSNKYKLRANAMNMVRRKIFTNLSHNT